MKEMRLRGIKTRDEANAFIGGYLSVHTRRFRVIPSNKTDVHITPERYSNLDSYLCIKTKRTVRNDNTVAHNKKLYQIKEKVMSRKVIVEERLNGSLHISGGGVSLKYREITKRPAKAILPEKRRISGKPHLPARDHPWKKPLNLKSIAREDFCNQLTK